MFKTELHCHSASVSACARVSNDIIIDRYTKGGYSTVVLTNHFNKGTMEHLGAESYSEFVDKYIYGFESLRNDAQGKLNILLGMELRFNENINDYLVFGVNRDFLLDVGEKIFSLNPEKFHQICKEKGLLFVQAHPFRNSMTVVNPCFLDGVEVFNGHMGHNSRNDIAEAWAEKHGLIKTSGTDFHYENVPTNAGILTEHEIKDLDTLIATLKNGNYSLVRG